MLSDIIFACNNTFYLQTPVYTSSLQESNTRKQYGFLSVSLWCMKAHSILYIILLQNSELDSKIQV